MFMVFFDVFGDCLNSPLHGDDITGTKTTLHDELVVKFCIGSMRLDAMAPLDVGLMHMEVS